MANELILFSAKENEGQAFTFSADAPVLPPEIDAKSESLIVSQGSIPCLLCSGQNYTGQAVQLVKGGGCDDLSVLPGGWLHRIRSVKFSHPLTTDVEPDTFELIHSKHLDDLSDPENQKRLAGLNPFIATAGCIFPNGTRTATFKNKPWVIPKVGSVEPFIVMNGDCVTYACANGQCVKTDGWHMKITQIDEIKGNPHAQLVITGV